VDLAADMRPKFNRTKGTGRWANAMNFFDKIKRCVISSMHYIAQWKQNCKTPKYAAVTSTFVKVFGEGFPIYVYLLRTVGTGAVY
jgi:hypothetical protein